jgi:predicted ATPase
MLQQLRIQNYKCLQDVTVEFGDFTVLIGPNDCGKSSILEVIRSLSAIASGKGLQFKENRLLSNLIWRKDLSLLINWEVKGLTNTNGFDFQIRLNPRDDSIGERLIVDGIDKTPETFRKPHRLPPQVLGQEQFRSIAYVLGSTIEYRLNPTQSYQPSVPQPNAVLASNGSNLADVVDGLRNHPDETLFESLKNDLRSAIPSLQGLRLAPVANSQGAKAIEYLLAGPERPPVSIPAELASQGALLVVAYLTLAYGNTPDCVLIEEPENGLHPGRVQTVVDILRKMSTGEIGNRKRQIIVTTHSPLLLNYVKPEEVRVVNRRAEEGAQVMPLSRARDIDKLLKEFGVGELWYLLGEEKLFEGAPA